MNKVDVERIAIFILVILVLVLGFFVIRDVVVENMTKVDPGYDYHYVVVGGNGTLRPNLELEEYNSPYGNMGYGSIDFIATPDEGYRIKQWTIDSRVVQDDNGEIFTGKNCVYSSVTVRTGNHIITVEFEPIPV